MLFLVTACNQSGKDYYNSGVKQFRKADHEDYYDWNYLKNARDDFEKAIKKGFVERDLYDDLSMCYLFLHDTINEERVYTLGLSHFPNDIRFHFNRGNLYKEAKKYKAAFLDYDKVVSLDTTSIYYKDALYYRGAMSYLLGDKEAANSDRIKAQKISDDELREYADYCKLWQ
jgi:tetratricopeptide (TPR) repeat protein